MKYVRSARNIALIVASALLLPALLRAADPPPHLLKAIAVRESENAYARNNYTYRQTVVIQEFDDRGLIAGEYQEVRDVTFSPEKGRCEQAVERPRNTLKRLKLTEQDFADIRNVQPFLLTNEEVPLYSWKYKGEEQKDGYLCFVVYVEPHQILAGQRFFQGLLWARESDLSVVRSEGEAVPQIESMKEENLFPHFTTEREEIDGKWFFPRETYADDTLYFRTSPQRIRVAIRYRNYQRFGAESVIRFSEPDKK